MGRQKNITQTSRYVSARIPQDVACELDRSGAERQPVGIHRRCCPGRVGRRHRLAGLPGGVRGGPARGPPRGRRRRDRVHRAATGSRAALGGRDDAPPRGRSSVVHGDSAARRGHIDGPSAAGGVVRICEACAPDPASWRRRAGDVPPCDCCGSWTKAVRRTAATKPLSRGLEVHRERTDRTTTPAERKAADGSVRNTSRAFRVIPAGWSREEDVQKRREAAAKRNAAAGRDAAWTC